MASREVRHKDEFETRRPPSISPDDEERALTAAAYSLARQQIEAGTASSQVITHFLKMGSSREHAEQERLKMEVELMKTKMANMVSAAKIEELYSAAITAMRNYGGDMSPAQEMFDD